jgi:hypothetical protein
MTAAIKNMCSVGWGSGNLDKGLDMALLEKQWHWGEV